MPPGARDLGRDAWELEEAFGLQLRHGTHLIEFDKALHPRDRTGKFAEKLGGIKAGERAVLPGGTRVVKHGPNDFEVQHARAHGVVRVARKSERAKSAADASAKALAADQRNVGHSKLGRPDFGFRTRQEVLDKGGSVADADRETARRLLGPEGPKHVSAFLDDLAVGQTASIAHGIHITRTSEKDFKLDHRLGPGGVEREHSSETAAKRAIDLVKSGKRSQQGHAIDVAAAGLVAGEGKALHQGERHEKLDRARGGQGGIDAFDDIAPILLSQNPLSGGAVGHAAEAHQGAHAASHSAGLHKAMSFVHEPASTGVGKLGHSAMGLSPHVHADLLHKIAKAIASVGHVPLLHAALADPNGPEATYIMSAYVEDDWESAGRSAYKALQEGRPLVGKHPLPRLPSINWDEIAHPRGHAGRFVDVPGTRGKVDLNRLAGHNERMRIRQENVSRYRQAGRQAMREPHSPGLAATVGDSLWTNDHGKVVIRSLSGAHAQVEDVQGRKVWTHIDSLMRGDVPELPKAAHVKPAFHAAEPHSPGVDWGEFARTHYDLLSDQQKAMLAEPNFPGLPPKAKRDVLRALEVDPGPRGASLRRQAEQPLVRPAIKDLAHDYREKEPLSPGPDAGVALSYIDDVAGDDWEGDLPLTDELEANRIDHLNLQTLLADVAQSTPLPGKEDQKAAALAYLSAKLNPKEPFSPGPADSPGRGPSGKLRNFKAMSDEKLLYSMLELQHYGMDPEATQAAETEYKQRKGMDPDANVGPAKVPDAPSVPTSSGQPAEGDLYDQLTKSVGGGGSAAQDFPIGSTASAWPQESPEPIVGKVVEVKGNVVTLDDGILHTFDASMLEPGDVTLPDAAHQPEAPGEEGQLVDNLLANFPDNSDWSVVAVNEDGIDVDVWDADGTYRGRFTSWKNGHLSQIGEGDALPEELFTGVAPEDTTGFAADYQEALATGDSAKAALMLDAELKKIQPGQTGFNKLSDATGLSIEALSKMWKQTQAPKRDYTKLTLQALSDLSDEGDLEAAAELVSRHAAPSHTREIHEVDEIPAGLLTNAESVGSFAGKHVVVTGKIEGFTRKEMEAKIGAMGGIIVPIDKAKAPDLVVVGDKAGSKLRKAKERKIPVLPASEALKLVEASWDGAEVSFAPEEDVDILLEALEEEGDTE